MIEQADIRIGRVCIAYGDSFLIWDEVDDRSEFGDPRYCCKFLDDARSEDYKTLDVLDMDFIADDPRGLNGDGI